MTTDDGQEQVISAKQVFYIYDKNDPEVKTYSYYMFLFRLVSLA